MNKAEIIDLQKRLRVEPDGFWGPCSIAASQRHLRALMPAGRWPKTDQASLTKFYGPAGDESRLVRFDMPPGTLYDGKPHPHSRINEACLESFQRILGELKTSFPEILAKFDGIYNNRPMRGGTTPSLHARGAAVDFDAGRNGNRVHWPLQATMPFGVMEIFAREGWLSAGAFWSRDAMHFQATQ